MKITCPQCSQQIEIDSETLANLQGHEYFLCPSCNGHVAVQSINSPRPVAPVKSTTDAAIRPSAPSKPPVSTRTQTHRGINRNLLILGSVALLVLGGLAAFIASRNSGNVRNTNQNINNEIIHNNYFTQLIASGATTEEDLDAVTDIRPYGSDFIGISKESLTWNEAQDMAKRTGAKVLEIGGNKERVVDWLKDSYKSHLNAPAWVAQNGTPSTYINPDIVATAVPGLSRKVILWWSSEYGMLPEPKTVGDSGWIPLFDGSDLSHWKGGKQESFPADAWSVEDGALRNIHGANDQNLETREKFRDFEMEFEWKFSGRGNSGIFYGLREFQLVDDATHPDGKVPETSCGALCYFIAPDAKKRLEPAEHYNRGRLLVSGNHVEHWINGEKVVEYELDSPDLKSLVKSAKLRNLAGFKKIGITASENSIGLQSHAGTVWFRNIRIRKLDTSMN